MPDDWDDHDGWESYYASLPSDDNSFNDVTKNPGSFSFNRLGSLIKDLRDQGWQRIWFPGCGFSPLPRAFASFGFTVHATDIAPSAIDYQATNKPTVKPLIADVMTEIGVKEHGTLNARIHDFRTNFDEDNIDVIFNIKSIQGLPLASMSAAIRSHFAALRSGGFAFFDTMNIQGERRDQFEDALVETGFYVPLYALDKWYRKTLVETGIPHMFILGAPMIPQRDDYPYSHKIGSPEYDRDIKILRDITSEYRSRMEREYELEQQDVNERTKHAQVIYSTG